MVKKGNMNKDLKTGKFLPKKSPEDILASLGSLNDVIDLKTELRALRNMLMKYLRGTLTNGKNEPITLDKDQANILFKYIELIADKLGPDAKGGEVATGNIQVNIKGPKKAPK